MAELIEVRVEDFRAFRKASLALSPEGLVLVAGPNNAGKSALLSAFDVIAKPDIPISRRHVAGDHVRILARWQLNDNERLELLGETQQTGDLIRQGAASWLEWKFSEFQDCIQPVTLSANWPKRDGLEFARIVELAPGQWQASNATQPLAAWDQTYSGRQSSGAGSVGDTLGLIGRNTRSLSLAIEILTQWRQGYYHFQPLREAQGRQVGLSNISPALDKSGANLAAVLLYLYTNEPSVWQQLVSLVRQIVPGVGN
jgi:energy-coupling factor transporter ATP-binding protein EcfA2